MNKNSEPSNEARASLPPISAERFDAMFDAGEDVSGYIDWEKGAMVAPGELSPGQKLSLVQTLLDELMAERSDSTPFLGEKSSLSVSIPLRVYLEVGREAARQGVSRESLVQSLITQRFSESVAK